jgi:2-polyprenyl-3-methyl-5-hydroxy-6-metoxy-1,4-benzoquinol methylase
MSNANYKEHGFADKLESHMHRHFMPLVFELAGNLAPGIRVLDVGCGNGATCVEFQKSDCKVTGVDLSEQGIEITCRTCPTGRFEVLPACDNLLASLKEEPFDVVVSTEVVEHFYAPRAHAHGCFHPLKPGGRFICTTTYHGCLKNLVLSALGKWDDHANPL